MPSATLALSVVVPCHNEVGALPLLLPRLFTACRQTGGSFEIILVNDGSTDATWSALEHLASQHAEIIGVNLARRYGQQIALSAGISLCRGENIFIIDADLQDPPELLPEMLRRIEAGADVVYGQRRSRHGETFFKRAAAKLFYRFMRMAGDEALPVDAGDFRLFNRRVWDLLQRMPERQRYLRGMIAWIGLKQVALPYDRQARPTGVSKYPLRRMLHFAMDAVTSFSIFPLRLSLWLGFACGSLALLLLLYVLGSWLLDDTVTGWTSLACIMLFFFGLQFFCIGMIGEYVGRIYLESKQRPMFIIDCLTPNATGTDPA